MVLGVSVGIYILLTSPVLDAAAGIKQQSATLADALSHARTLISVRDSLLTKYKQIPAGDLEKLTKFLPDGVDNVRLVIDLKNIVAKYGLDLKNVRVSSLKAQSPDDRATVGRKYESVTLGFSVTANYDLFRLLLADLEKSLRIIDITSLSFSASERDQYDFNIQVRTYWLKAASTP